jgi:hypothetical protein
MDLRLIFVSSSVNCLTPERLRRVKIFEDFFATCRREFSLVFPNALHSFELRFNFAQSLQPA